MNIEIGSNVYRNTNGVVEMEGVQQFNVSVKPTTGAILLNFVLFDQNGRMTAKVIDSNLAFNERRACEIVKTPTSVELKDVEAGHVVIRVAKPAEDRIVIDQGKFWTIKGHLCTISESACKIDKHTLSKQSTDAKGGNVSIGG
ncbi:MAG: hypothetical protein U0172_02905 [Nitrospiraceae bacterium]